MKYAPRKPGLLAKQIEAAKAAARLSEDMLRVAYGGSKVNASAAFIEAWKWRCVHPGHVTKQAHSFTDRGDFAGCYGGLTV